MASLDVNANFFDGPSLRLAPIEFRAPSVTPVFVLFDNDTDLASHYAYSNALSVGSDDERQSRHQKTPDCQNDAFAPGVKNGHRNLPPLRD
jgi:hypothetical protein